MAAKPRKPRLMLTYYSDSDILPSMGRKEIDLAEQLRDAVRESGLSRFALSKQARVPYATVFHFMAGRNIGLDSASRIASVINVELRGRKRQEK